MKQDGGSNHLRGYSKILHHTVKSREEKPKKITNQKKRLVFPRNQTIFRAWQSSRTYIYIYRNSATFKTELFATIGNRRKLQKASSDELTTNGQYLHVAAQGGYCFLEYKFLVFPGIFQVLFLFFQLFFFSSKQD